MKYVKCYLLIIIATIILSGCQAESVEIFSLEKLDADIARWSSEMYEGREAGTKGNFKARDDIAKEFKKIGLEPLQSQDYFLPFPMIFWNSEAVQTKLEVHLKNGETKEFLYGEDWMKRMSSGINVELPILLAEPNKEISTIESDQHIIVTEEVVMPLDEIRIQFIKTDTFKKTLTEYSSQSSAFQISGSFYTYLKKNEKDIDYIHLIYYKAPFEQITTHNVVGKISGNRDNVGKQAIVISAHFDHVGTTGKSIFLGSIDNATGLTGVMNLAKILKEDSKDKSFSSDILFVAFNAEENGLLGSTAFVEEIASEYDSIININLDCIGIKDGGKISFVGEPSGSSNLNELFEKIAVNQEVESKSILEEFASMTSDHVSFLRYNFQAINISQEKFDKIHTTADTPAYTDSKPLKAAIELVQAFVNNYHNTKFEKMENLNSVLNTDIRDFTQIEAENIQSTFADSSYKIVNSHYKFMLNESDNDYGNAYLTVQKENKDYFISIFRGEVEIVKDPSDIETIGSWKLLSDTDESSIEKIYTTAVSMINVENEVFTVLLQNYDEKASKATDTYSKEELESFIAGFNHVLAVQQIIKMTY